MESQLNAAEVAKILEPVIFMRLNATAVRKAPMARRARGTI
jgi:hypothetical protein